MQKIVPFVRRVVLFSAILLIGASPTASAVANYEYRILQDQLWYEQCGDGTTPASTAPDTGDEATEKKDKIAKLLIPLFNSAEKDGALKAIEKYKFGGMAMTGDGRAFDKAFFDDAKSKAGGQFVPMADEEGGNVARYGIATKAASQLARLSDSDVKKEGKRVGEALRGYGIEVNLAPVLDIETPGRDNHLRQGMGGQSRAFGTTDAVVTAKAGAFAAGLNDADVKPTYKHFPGLGQATAHTDFRPATLDYNNLQNDLKPFKALANQHSGLVMLSNAIITGLGGGGNGLPAPTNPALIEKLRGEIGFSGTVITDDLDAVAKWPGQPPLPTIVANSIKAGSDLLLFKYPGDAVMDQIIDKINKETPDERVNEAYEKYQSEAAETKGTMPTSVDASCCSSGSSEAVVASTGEGGGCGEKGYFEGKQLSKANKDQIWGFFKGQGLSDEAVAGIMGNSQIESAFMPDADNGRTMGFAHESTGRGCVGIFQWCDRRPGLESFAKERGKEWDCLGIQLEFAWHEVNGTEKAVMAPLKAAKSAGEAARIWNTIYERSGEVGSNRIQAAEAILKEYTGKGGSVGENSEASSAGCPDSGGGASVMSEDCSALVAKYKQLRGSKLTETSGKDIDQDLKNCTTKPIECGLAGGSGGGVHPKLLRALIAAVENSGGEKLRVWNINTRHPCDGLNHPKGKASDIYCQVPSRSDRGEGPSADKCLRIFKYLYDNYDKLGLSELIWNENTPFSKMGDGKHMYVDGHDDHIHIGVKS